MKTLDFDHWMSLHRNEPDIFEARRKQAINRLIRESKPKQRKRLESLQWRIDMERNRSKNALDSCLRIHRMMMDSVFGKHGLHESIRQLDLKTPTPSQKKAQVIPIQKGQKST